MQRWLLSRLFDLKSNEQTAPYFAFNGTVNWMRSLSLCVEAGGFSKNDLRNFYRHVERAPLSPDADTLVFENIFMAFNHLSGLISISDEVSNGYDVCRPAINAWYHGVYSAASAMVSAATRSLPNTRESVQSVWHSDLVEKGLVVNPFSLKLSSLVRAVYEQEIIMYRGDNRYDVNSVPQSYEQAWGGVVSYLNGTAEYEYARLEPLIRETEEFKALNVDNFRKVAARSVRDSYLRGRKVDFLVEAFRYVGKANYRDSIFLSYGDDRRGQIDQFLSDLARVGKDFLRMACSFSACRVEQGAWDCFVADVEINSQLTLDPDVLKV